MVEYLFIGGSKNYEIISVGDGCEEYVIPCELTLEKISDLNKDLPENEKILDVEVYKRRGFGNGEIFLLWNNGIHRFSKMDLDAIALFRRPRL